MEIKKILVDAWTHLASRKQKLLRILSVPFLVLIILGGVYPYQTGTVFSLLVVLPSILVASMIAVAVHRTILLPPEATSDAILLPDKRVFVFIVYSIGLSIILLPFAIILAAFPVGIYFYFICAAYLLGRLSLVFPAIAVDAAWTFGDSWRATKDHHITMFLVIGLLPLLLMFIDAQFLGPTFFGVLWSLVSAILFLYFIAVLSVSFNHLRDRI